jgi:hypothetical protein
LVKAEDEFEYDEFECSYMAWGEENTEYDVE